MVGRSSEEAAKLFLKKKESNRIDRKSIEKERSFWMDVMSGFEEQEDNNNIIIAMETI
jgi:hypothetical protein